MMDRIVRTLPPAIEADAETLAEKLLGSGDASVFEDLSQVHKVVCSRACDAAAPVVLSLARRLRDGGPVEAPDGTKARFVDLAGGWTPAVAVERPGSRGHLFAVSLEVPLDRSETYRERVERASASAVDGSGDDIAREAVAEIEVEEGMRRDGLPRDLPSPDGFSTVETMRVSTYAVEADSPREAESFAAFASRMRNAAPPDIDEVLASVAGGRYDRGRLFDVSMPHVSDHAPGTYFPGTLQGPGVREWPTAFSTLSSAVAAAGLGDAMAEAAREVASRRYRTYPANADPSLDAMATDLALMDAIGQSVAFLDGGLPGPGAVAFAERFEGRARERHLAGRLDDLLRFVSGLREAGHSSEAQSLEYNDLDNAAWVEDFREGDLLVLTEQNADFAVVVERDAGGAASRIAMARHGRPVEDYEARHAAKAWSRVEGDDGFHRDHANDADAMAPLSLRRAAEAMLSDSPDFPGFLGRFAVDADGLRCDGPVAFDGVATADLAALLDDVEFGARELGVPAAPAP